MFYIIKTVNGVHSIKNKSDQPGAPRGCEFIKGPDVKFPKIVDTNGLLSVVNDEAKKTEHDNKKALKVSDKAAMKQIIDDATTVQALRQILKKTQ